MSTCDPCSYPVSHASYIHRYSSTFASQPARTTDAWTGMSVFGPWDRTSKLPYFFYAVAINENMIDGCFAACINGEG